MMGDNDKPNEQYERALKRVREMPDGAEETNVVDFRHAKAKRTLKSVGSGKDRRPNGGHA